jgi:hypothetical protein
MEVGLLSTKEDNIDLISLVPSKFRNWGHIITKEAAAKSPGHEPYDHGIDINDGESLAWGPYYALSEIEEGSLCDWLKDMLETGKIRPSKLPARSIIRFVPKVYGQGLRLCTDYTGFNKIRIANWYPRLIIYELKKLSQRRPHYYSNGHEEWLPCDLCD